MHFHKSLFILLLICFNNSYSQTGPGGVGANDATSNLVLWLDSSAETTGVNGSPFPVWHDQSGHANDAVSPTADAQPIFVSSSVNGYSSLGFDGGNDEYRVVDDASIDLTQWHIFIVPIVNRSKNFNSWLVKGFGGSGSQENYELLSFRSNNIHVPIRFTTGARTFPSTTFGSQVTETNFNVIEYSFSSPVGRDIYKNGANIHTDNENRIPLVNNSSMYIGSEEGTSGRNIDGSLAEILMYNAPLNSVQRTIVNNYLAAKYERATSNDLYTQDNPANGNYDHKVAGIGRVDASNLHDDSKGTGIVQINSPSNLGDNEYLFWGENVLDSDYAFTASAAANYRDRLNTVWRVSEIGDVGTVTISIDASDIHLNSLDGCNNLSLAVSSSATFPSPTTYSLTLSSGVYTATGVDFADGDYFTVEYLDQIVWDGTSFFNGSGAGNAPDITDQCLKFTVKPGAAGTLTFNAHVREVEVESGGTINVADGILLQVENQVQVDGVIDLLGEAELVQNHTSTTSNSGMGELRVRQQGTSSLYNYNYWSAPVNRASAGGAWQIGFLEDANGVIPFTTAYDADPSTMPITLSNYWLHEFNATTGVYTGWHRLSTTSNLSPGTGYTMKGSGATSPEQEYIFKGIPNDGNYTHTVVTAGNDFLVGNPYPSRLNANQFITDNLSIIDGSLYFWEQFSTNNSHVLRDYQGGYAVYNLMMSSSAAVPDASGLTSGQGMESKGVPTQNIAVGQGFFVTINNSGSIVFNNAQRVVTAGPSVFYKNSKKGKESVSPIDNRPKIWFSFTDPNEYTKVLGLGYDPDNATYAYDNGYDAKSYENNRNDVSWSLNGEKLIIQALSTINIQDELPLAVKATDVGIYKLSINKTENLPDNLNIFLKDNQQNVFYDLKAGEAQILINENTEHNHFSIVFNNNSVLNTTNNAKTEKFFTAYNSKTKHLKLHNVNNDLSAIKSLNIYNTLGQLIKNFKSLNANNSINLSNLNDGIYILKIGTKNSENITGIKFIKY